MGREAHIHVWRTFTAVVLITALACGRWSYDPRATGDEVGGDPDAGPDPVLIDTGLVVRYPLSEGAGNTLHTTVGGPTLSLTNTGATSWLGAATGQALRFESAGLDDRACAPIAGTSAGAALEGSPTVTIEVVANVEEAVDSGSRIAHIGRMSDWTLSLGFSPSTSELGNTALIVGINNNHGYFPLDITGLGRRVYTVILDTTQPVVEDRGRLYIDGEAWSGEPIFDDIAQNTSPSFTTDELCLGNRAIGARTFRGELHYAAYYTGALSPGEVAHNAAILADDDD